MRWISPKASINKLTPIGISYVLKSMTLSTISAEVNKQYITESILQPFTKKISTYQTPLSPSTKGYWRDICVLHFRHRPRKNMYEKSGIRSNHANWYPHDMQCDLSFAMLSLSGIRNMQTFKKLPITIPNKKITTYKIIP